MLKRGRLMSHLLRLCLCAAMGCVLLGSVCALCPQWGIDRVLRDWDELARQQRLRAELDSQVPDTADRIVGHDAVVHELIAGRLTLLEAAARFRSQDYDLPPERRGLTRRRYAGG